MFIGGETESAFFQDKYKKARGQLIVLYGRSTGIYKMKEIFSFILWNRLYSSMVDIPFAFKKINTIKEM